MLTSQETNFIKNGLVQPIMQKGHLNEPQSIFHDHHFFCNFCENYRNYANIFLLRMIHKSFDSSPLTCVRPFPDPLLLESFKKSFAEVKDKGMESVELELESLETDAFDV